MSADRSRTDSPGPLPQDKLLRLQTVFLGGLFTLGIFYTLYLAAEIFIPISLALLLNLLLAPAVLGLQRYRVPAPLGAAVILLLFLGTVIAAVFYLSEPAKTWIDRAPGSLRIVEYKVRAVVQTIEEVKKTTAEVEQMTNLDDGETEQSVVVKRESLTETLVSGTQRFAASAMITIVLLYFLLSTGDLFLRKVIRLSPTFKDKRKNVTIARQMEQEISRYLVTITAANCVLGGCLALALYLLGVPNPLLWGVAAALLNFIPYIGAMAMLGVLGFVSLLTFYTWGDILLPPGIFLVLTVLEGQILTPALLGRRFSLNPVFVFLALIVWGWIWGVFGLFMAVPLLVSLKIICDHADSLAPLAEFLSSRSDHRSENRREKRT